MNKNNIDPISEALVLLFQPFCEVIIHDLNTDTVKKVYGTNDRKIGEPSFLNELKIDSWQTNVHGPYSKMTPDGQTIKSISIIIRDESFKPAELMCINMDVSHFEAARNVLSNLISIPEKELNNPLANDWVERLHTFIANWATTHGIQIKNIRPDMREKLVLKLHENGVFDQKNSVLAVAKALGVSRATIYQDLRKKDG